jgi:hypothetical protein
MANEGYHEPIDELTDDTRDMHRAITSLIACGDDSRMDTPQGSVV